MTASLRRPPSWLRQAWLVARKELLLERRSAEIASSSGLFAVLIVVLGSMAFFAGPSSAADVAPGVIWVAVSFAAVLALGRSWQREREQDALAGLLCAPIARSALFAGKALGLGALCLGLELLVVPLAALLLDVPLGRAGPGIALVCLVATPGIAAAGTLFGAMTVRTGARELVLATVLFPLLAPTILAAAVATRELCAGAALGEVAAQLGLVALFDVVFVAGGLALFGSLIED